jgi:Na+/H+ antiporter NhaA
MYITAKKFVRAKSFSGIVLFFATIMALILANSSFSSTYFEFLLLCHFLLFLMQELIFQR